MADPLVLISEIDRATARLLTAARALDEAAVRGPSLLPGWTRGHVLTHVARNADSVVNLLTWARTGVETAQYVSFARREADIQAGAARPIAEQVADLEESAGRLDEAVRQLPPSGWTATIRWMDGMAAPAASTTWARLREVEVHHVDLDAGYRPADWPARFVHRLLHELATAFSAKPAVAPMRLHADDLGHDLDIGAGRADGGPPAGDLGRADGGAPVVSGPGHVLAAWLSGRADGTGLAVTPDGPLPAVPAWR
jgi:maleylpyruvate isomerase